MYKRCLQFITVALMGLLPCMLHARVVTTLARLQLQTATGDYDLSSIAFESETEAIEHKVVSETGVEVIMKVPGRLTWGNVILTRPLGSDTSWWDWRAQVENGDVAGARQDFSIIAYDETGSPFVQWDFVQGWPAAIENTTLGTNSIAGEQMILVHEGLSATDPTPNRAPTISMRGSFQAAVGSTATFTVTASDPDLDPVTLANVLAPAGATFQNGVFRWAIPLEQIETAHTVSFTANDQQREPNSITTRQLTITVPRDFDNDSLDDDWEIIWIGSLATSGTDNSDGDGASNLQEFIAGTNPTNAASSFKIIEFAQSNQTVGIHYIAEPGREYQLECNINSLSDSNGWSQIGNPWQEDATLSTPRQFSPTSPTNGQAFYRIQVRRLSE